MRILYNEHLNSVLILGGTVPCTLHSLYFHSIVEEHARTTMNPFLLHENVSDLIRTLFSLICYDFFKEKEGAGWVNPVGKRDPLWLSPRPLAQTSAACIRFIIFQIRI